MVGKARGHRGRVGHREKGMQGEGVGRKRVFPVGTGGDMVWPFDMQKGVINDKGCREGLFGADSE